MQLTGRAPGARPIVVVTRGRVVTVAPVAHGRLWALVLRKSLQTGLPPVYALP